MYTVCMYACGVGVCRCGCVCMYVYMSIIYVCYIIYDNVYLYHDFFSGFPYIEIASLLLQIQQ